MTEPVQPDPVTDGREDDGENELAPLDDVGIADGIDLDREYRDRAIADLEDEGE